MNAASIEKMNLQHKINRSAIIFAFSKMQSTFDENLLNKTVSDIMNAAISHKCRSITLSGGITSRKNYKNLIIQIHNLVIENDSENLKFIIFHVDDIN